MHETSSFSSQCAILRNLNIFAAATHWDVSIVDDFIKVAFDDSV
jgi:hypothetical protein